MEHTRAVIYVRASQDRDGTARSVDQQLSECQQFAERRGITVVRVLQDNDLSAYTGKRRPGYEELLNLIARGEVDAVIVWEQSRLTRRPMELEGYIAACEPRQLPTYSVTGGAVDLTTVNGRMNARIIGAVNRQEVEQLIIRVKRGLTDRRAKGLPVGGRRPFGFKPDKVTHDPVEAAAIRDATEKLVGGESVRAIAQQWRERGLVTTTGREWTSSQLRALLRRARNAGLIEHNSNIVGKAAWEPIVPVDMWRACVSILSDPTRRTTPGNQPAYLGTFIYRCGALIDGEECGKLMRSWRSGKDGTRIYRCSTTDRTRNGATERHVTVPIAEADEYVSRFVIAGLLELTAIEVPAQNPVESTPTPAKSIENIDERERTFTDLFDSGILSADLYRERMTMLALEREQLASANTVPIHDSDDDLYDLATGTTRWQDLSIERQRAFISENAIVTILPIGSGRRAPISDRVRIELVDTDPR